MFKDFLETAINDQIASEIYIDVVDWEFMETNGIVQGQPYSVCIEVITECEDLETDEIYTVMYKVYLLKGKDEVMVIYSHDIEGSDK